MFEPVENKDRSGGSRPAAKPRQARDADAPLLDLGAVIESIWRHKFLIIVTTIIGAVLGVMLALSTPHTYYATARLYVDPRDIRTEENEPGSQLLPTEAMLALVDSQMEILTSTDVLQAVIDDLDLIDDAEFNGSLEATGLEAVIAAMNAFFSDEDADEISNRVVLDNLRDAVYVTREAQTFIVNVTAETLDPDKSAEIANSVVENYLLSEADARSGTLERTSQAFQSRIDELRTDLDSAERAVENYKAESGIIGASGQVVGETQLLGYSERLTDARADRVQAEARVDALQSTNVNDVLSGAIPRDLSSDTLTGLRTEYASLRAQADSLSTRLGPRHPQMIAIQSQLNTARQEVANELSRIVAATQTELNRARETEEQLAAQLAVLQSEQLATNVDSVELRQLEREAAATRQIYEDFLLRARRASERQNLAIANVRVVSQAEPPLDPAGSSRKIIAIAGALLGFMVGVGIAVLSVLVRTFAGRDRQAGRRDGEREIAAPSSDQSRTPPIAPIAPSHQVSEPAPAFASPASDPNDLPTSSGNVQQSDPRTAHQVQSPPADPMRPGATWLRPGFRDAKDAAVARPPQPQPQPDRFDTPATGQPAATHGAAEPAPQPGEPGWLEADEAELRDLRERMRRLRMRAESYSRMGFES